MIVAVTFFHPQHLYSPENYPLGEETMSLKLYFAHFEDFTTLSAAVTAFESIEEARKDVQAAGSEETVCSFLTIEGTAADALDVLACLGVGERGSMERTLAALAVAAFKCGLNAAAGHESTVTANADKE